jgi:hypothetical protein
VRTQHRGSTQSVADAVRPQTSRSRPIGTVLGTLAVVTAEFVLLSGVYERAVPVGRAEVVVSALDGQHRSVTPAQTATSARQALPVADRAAPAGAPSVDGDQPVRRYRTGV